MRPPILRYLVHRRTIITHVTSPVRSEQGRSEAAVRLVLLYTAHGRLCQFQTVHGGLIMSLTDTMGSLAVATKGQFLTGVSVDIGTSFVKPGGRVGDELRMSAVIVGIGL